MNEFEKNKPKRIKEFKNKLDELYGEYHAELYLNDKVYSLLEELKNESVKK